MKTTILLILALAASASATWAADSGPALEATTFQTGAHPIQSIDPEAATPYRVELPYTVRGDEELPCGGKRVGNIESAPPEARASLALATWYDQSDGSSIARVEFYSADATGLRVELESLSGLELRVYDPIGLTAVGPYTNPALSEKGSFWSTIVFGDRIGLEFRLSPGMTRVPALPEILSVAYMYEDFSRNDRYPPPGTCDEDINCYPAWAGSTEDNAVGLMLFNCDESGCGQCTGAMLNRSGSDYAPIFMTARHCINDQASAATLIVFWEFKTDVCDGTDPPLNTLPRNDGSQLLKTNYDSDWTILGLWENSRSSGYLGWDSNYLANGTSTTGVHHPGGMSKRISFGEKTQDASCLGASEWRIDHSLGRTFPGASGSPLYDSNRRVRGTLSCDNRECPTDQITSYATYGRMDVAFPVVRWFIYDMADPTYVTNTVTGDPGNDGDTERGAYYQPFNTVFEGSYCIPSGGSIYINPGSYNEQFTIRRPMTLQRWGSSGTVVIGTP